MPEAPAIPETIRQRLVRYQRDELTDLVVYGRLARSEKNQTNRAVLERIASDEREHAAVWKRYTGEDAAPNRWRALFFTLVGYILGYTFVIKLMERGETLTAKEYAALADYIPEARGIMEQEEQHEERLHSLLDEERLHYVGAMVLGLNDALVELTGTIAGLTLALQDNRLVALAGIVTGVSATLSMAASNYLAERADGKDDAIKSSVYTGVAYLLTVVVLVLPYLLLPDTMYWGALAMMLVAVILIIFFFNFYVSVAKDQPFWSRFVEMACISLGVAVISFIIGLAAKYFLQVDI
jgi:Uncharacterized membrane protein